LRGFLVALLSVFVATSVATGCARFAPLAVGAAGFGAQLGSVLDNKDRLAGAAIGAGVAVALAAVGWWVSKVEREDQPPAKPLPGILGDTHVTQPASSPASLPTSAPAPASPR
jgi:hypothetical protein